MDYNPSLQLVHTFKNVYVLIGKMAGILKTNTTN